MITHNVHGNNKLTTGALRSGVIVLLLSLNHLFMSIFAYYNCKNNRYNRFVKAYRKPRLLLSNRLGLTIKISEFEWPVSLIASFNRYKRNWRVLIAILRHNQLID